MNRYVKAKQLLTCLAMVGGVVLINGEGTNADLTFGEPTNLGPGLNTPFADCGPSISADGLTLYFSNAYWNPNPAGFGGGDIWMATRSAPDQPWASFTNLGAPISTAYNEGTPSISSDGLSLFFGSDRVGGRGRQDLWVSTRPTIYAAWDTPQNLGPVVNTTERDGMPCISQDGLTLYFASLYRPGGMGDRDLWLTRRPSLSQPWAPPENLGFNVNSSASDSWPCLSPDGLTLVFSSTRLGGYGDSDLWVSTRAASDGQWGPALNLGPIVNSNASEQSPHISPDGKWLCFSSDRTGGAGDLDIWQAEIFWEPTCGDQDHPYPTGDLNQDCRVDYLDLALLCECWLQDNNP
jgi:Tol biopolymer transport system component